MGHVSVYLSLDEEAVTGEVTALYELTLLEESRAAFFRKKTKVVQSRPPLRFGFTGQQRSCGVTRSSPKGTPCRSWTLARAIPS